MASKHFEMKDSDNELGRTSSHSNISSYGFTSSRRLSRRSFYDGSQAYDDDDEESVGRHREEMKIAAKRTWIITFLVILMGTAASTLFLYIGISTAQRSEEDRFRRHAQDLSKEIVSSFRDYETAAAWIHETCRDWRGGSFTRKDFRILYNYLINGGLDFFLAEWVPNITYAERAALEAEAAAYYANDTNVNYKGFIGLGRNPANPEEFGLFPRSEQPVYFPIHFLEPYERIGEAAHLDLYSILYERQAIDLAIQTFKPVLTERFVIVSQETDGYSVSLIHPGVPLPDDIYEKPQDLSLLLIHIRSLLARAARYQGFSLAVYLYDATNANADGSPQQYLGGAKITMKSDTDSVEKDITYYSEVELEDVRKGADLYYEGKMQAGARDWTIAVVPVDDSYVPNHLLVILCSVMIFAATLLLAWVWILHNKKRSSHLEQIITQSEAFSAIVTSLYPAAVRDRLIHQKEDHDDPKVDPKEETNESSKSGEKAETDGSDSTMPIAELYPNSTILFADLAGFTFWSSTREPQTVFKLLETLYQAFDEQAKRRKVFKVETIGDCYVAVTGIPKPQTKHAVIMARFASACLTTTNELVAQLAVELGEDTRNLQMRVGLNSGSVTGGVLRGDKSRFQLFGDSVNTAARMESNGIKGRIHCSQSTADALVEAGKGHWLSTREDKVVAKGKGEMQTYWINVFESAQIAPGAIRDSEKEKHIKQGTAVDDAKPPESGEQHGVEEQEPSPVILAAALSMGLPKEQADTSGEQQEALPQNTLHQSWNKYTAPNGINYYHNVETGETTYKVPDVLQNKKKKLTFEIRDGWHEYTDPKTGEQYYSNGVETQWKKPESV